MSLDDEILRVVYLKRYAMSSKISPSDEKTTEFVHQAVFNPLETFNPNLNMCCMFANLSPSWKETKILQAKMSSRPLGS